MPKQNIKLNAPMPLPCRRRNLNRKERLFCTFTGIPKATVQAAIGSIPLALGLPSGWIILAVAIVSILVTAPLGAICIDSTYKKLLTRQPVEAAA